MIKIKIKEGEEVVVSVKAKKPTIVELAALQYEVERLTDQFVQSEQEINEFLFYYDLVKKREQ